MCLDVTPANASADAAASRRTQTCSGTGTNGCAGRDLPSRDRVERRLPRARTRGHARGHRAKQQRAAPRWHCHARGAGRYGVVRSGLQLSLPWVGSRPVTAGAGPRRLSSLVGAGTASVEQAGRRGCPCTPPRRHLALLLRPPVREGEDDRSAVTCCLLALRCTVPSPILVRAQRRRAKRVALPIPACPHSTARSLIRCIIVQYHPHGTGQRPDSGLATSPPPTPRFAAPRHHQSSSSLGKAFALARLRKPSDDPYSTSVHIR